MHPHPSTNHMPNTCTQRACARARACACPPTTRCAFGQRFKSQVPLFTLLHTPQVPHLHVAVRPQPPKQPQLVFAKEPRHGSAATAAAAASARGAVGPGGGCGRCCAAVAVAGHRQENLSRGVEVCGGAWRR
eukprot:359013-Chlamydomonas_euryale.AAC.11